MSRSIIDLIEIGQIQREIGQMILFIGQKRYKIGQFIKLIGINQKIKYIFNYETFTTQQS